MIYIKNNNNDEYLVNGNDIAYVKLEPFGEGTIKSPTEYFPVIYFKSKSLSVAASVHTDNELVWVRVENCTMGELARAINEDRVLGR